jgi:hypothetical protein
MCQQCAEFIVATWAAGTEPSADYRAALRHLETSQKPTSGPCGCQSGRLPANVQVNESNR